MNTLRKTCPCINLWPPGFHNTVFFWCIHGGGRYTLWPFSLPCKEPWRTLCYLLAAFLFLSRQISRVDPMMRVCCCWLSGPSCHWSEVHCLSSRRNDALHYHSLQGHPSLSLLRPNIACKVSYFPCKSKASSYLLFSCLEQLDFSVKWLTTDCKNGSLLGITPNNNNHKCFVEWKYCF